MATENIEMLQEKATAAARAARDLSGMVQSLADQAGSIGNLAAAASGNAIDPFVFEFAIFILAVFVGYFVVWAVTPALHTPLMAVTNAVSAIIIVGAMLAVALTEGPVGQFMGTLAVALAAVNVFGGFLVTQRMLEMFKKKEPKAKKEGA